MGNSNCAHDGRAIICLNLASPVKEVKVSSCCFPQKKIRSHPSVSKKDQFPHTDLKGIKYQLYDKQLLSFPRENTACSRRFNNPHSQRKHARTVASACTDTDCISSTRRSLFCVLSSLWTLDLMTFGVINKISSPRIISITSICVLHIKNIDVVGHKHKHNPILFNSCLCSYSK